MPDGATKPATMRKEMGLQDMFFGKKKKTMPEISFDPNTQKAVLKCSICNGEQVAGFKDIATGAFTEVMR